MYCNVKINYDDDDVQSQNDQNEVINKHFLSLALAPYVQILIENPCLISKEYKIEDVLKKTLDREVKK